MNEARVTWLPGFVRRYVAGRNGLQQVVANAGWLFADKVIRLGVGLFVWIWVARYLGPQQFGLLNYAMALAALCGVLAGLGLDGIVVRNLVRNPEHRDWLLGTAFMLKLAGGIVAFVLSLAVATLLRPHDALALWLVGIVAAGTIFQALDAIDFWFQSRVESRYVVYARNAAFLAASVAKIALILAQAPLIAFAWVALGEIALGAGGLLTAYRWQGHGLRAWRSTPQCAGELLKESWPLVLSGLAITVYMKIDVVMLGEMVGDQAVGIYSATVRVSEIWYFIPVAIVSSVTPALIEAKKVSEGLYYQRLARLFRLLAGVALTVAILMTFGAGFVTDLLYGEAYSGASVVLAIHIWAAVFVFLGVAQGPWSINEGLTKLLLFRTLFGAIANIALNLMLIPSHGAIGAAVATVISQALSAVVLNAFNSKTRKIFVLQVNAMNPFPAKTGKRMS